MHVIISAYIIGKIINNPCLDTLNQNHEIYSNIEKRRFDVFFFFQLNSVTRYCTSTFFMRIK